MPQMKVTVRLRTDGCADLEMIVYTLDALKHLTYTLICWVETQMPEWAEIMYFGLTKQI